MQRFLRTLLIVTVALALPVIPLLVFGPTLEVWMQAFLHEQATAGWTASAVVLLLSTDVFLPVPSSVVATIAGGRLGVGWGTAAAWSGMSLGAVLGYVLARRFGRPLAERLLSAEQLALDSHIAGSQGVWLLVFTRAIPVVAEAMVLLAGVHRMAWYRFLPVVLLSNLGMTLAYTTLGSIAARQQWLPAALGWAAALPLLLPALFRRWSPAANQRQ